MKKKIVQLVFLATAIFCLYGCASGYDTFYTPSTSMNPERVLENRVSSVGLVPKLERSLPVDGDSILASYAKRGYVMIGQSMFNSGANESETSAIKQGQKVGADLVLVLNPEYTGSETLSIPITTPTTSTSYTTGSATIYGQGGTYTARGNATTTTYGSTTAYVPMTIHRSNYGAIYFVKQRFTLGAFFRDLVESERQELQTNQGAVIIVVVDDTPAFFQDIIPGDIIMKVDEVRVPNEPGLTRLIGERRGKKITISLIRKGVNIDKIVQLNN